MDIIFGSVEGVYSPQNTPMLWQFIIAGTNERFEPQKYTHKLDRLLLIHLLRWRGAQGLMWGTRGPFLPAAAMVVAVVTPVLFYAKANEKRNKNTKISCLLLKSLFITIYCKTYCNSCIANCSVAEPEL